MFVPMKTGEVVDVDELDLENLSPARKEEMRINFEESMRKMEMMMARLQG
jgi:hypothetical protein